MHDSVKGLVSIDSYVKDLDEGDRLLTTTTVGHDLWLSWNLAHFKLPAAIFFTVPVNTFSPNKIVKVRDLIVQHSSPVVHFGSLVAGAYMIMLWIWISTTPEFKPAIFLMILMIRLNTSQKLPIGAPEFDWLIKIVEVARPVAVVTIITSGKGVFALKLKQTVTPTVPENTVDR